MGAGSICEVSALYSQFCCEPKRRKNKEEKIKKKKLGQPGTPFQVILIRALSI